MTLPSNKNRVVGANATQAPEQNRARDGILTLSFKGTPEWVYLPRGADIALNFNHGKTAFSQKGDNLLLTGPDGSVITVTDFLWWKPARLYQILFWLTEQKFLEKNFLPWGGLM